MPNWTTATLVKDHLLHAFQGSLHFEDEEVTLSGTTPSNLQNRLLSSASETVKWNIGKVPTEETVTMTDQTPETLSNSYIIKGSVFVSLHPVLDTTYVEQKDYIVAYDSSNIWRPSGSTIPNTTVVYVWYLYSTKFTITTDYLIDYKTGTLTRVAGGGIPNEATVLIDYDVDAASISDALIDAAILEAEDKILGRLSTSYGAASADQGLKTGATEFALSIILQALNIYVLQHEGISDADQRAEEFRNQSLKFENQAWRTLAPFLDPSARSRPQAI